MPEELFRRRKQAPDGQSAVQAPPLAGMRDVDALLGGMPPMEFGLADALKREVSTKRGEAQKPLANLPGSPVKDAESLFTGGATQRGEEAKKDTMTVSDGIDAADIGAAATSVQNLYTTGGATGKLTPQQTYTIGEKAQEASASEVIAAGGGAAAKVSGGARARLSGLFDATRTDAETTSNAADITANLEQAEKIVVESSAKSPRRRQGTA
jgi:hypothetical protein